MRPKSNKNYLCKGLDLMPCCLLDDAVCGFGVVVGPVELDVLSRPSVVHVPEVGDPGVVVEGVNDSLQVPAKTLLLLRVTVPVVIQDELLPLLPSVVVWLRVHVLQVLVHVVAGLPADAILVAGSVEVVCKQYAKSLQYTQE